MFDVRNEGNVSGSIYKPDLSISLPKINLTYRISPKTKSYETYNHSSNGSMSSHDTRTINHGASVFLYGGGSDRLELSYYFGIKTDEHIAFVNEAKKDPSAIQYSLITTDNSGKEVKILVANILEERDFGIN